MTFVLDASVALTWLLRGADVREASFAFAVLKTLRAEEAVAHVPGVWGLEVANVIARSEARGIVASAQSAAFLSLLNELHFEVDAAADLNALVEILPLAREHRLTSYDASYLALALRRSLPLASLDEDLRRAASKAGVPLLKV